MSVTNQQRRGFVGRGRELDALEHAVADARRGQPSIVVVSGEAGIGKSTLLAEAAARSSSPLVIGRCMQLGGEVTPLSALVDLLRHVQRLAPDAVAETEGLSTFAPWLSPRPGVEGAAPRPSAEGVFAPVLDLLGRVAVNDALVVAFEDVHWADNATWDLIDLLARNLVDEHVVLVASYRGDELARDASTRRRVAELGRLPNASRLELSGLGRDDVAARIAAITGGTAEAVLVDSVYQRSEGNPFFAEELVRAHLEGEALPDVLSDLIVEKMAALGEAARGVLDAAAAIGREVQHDVLTGVVEMDDRQLELALREAIDAQLLLVDASAEGYRFRHALIAEVVYAELLPSQRRRLHRHIATVLAERVTDTFAAERTAQLAFHLDRAGDAVGAFAALLAAADAAEVVAPAVALRQLERAFELWDDAGEASRAENRCERLWQAAELAAGTAGNDRAVAIAHEAFKWGTPARGAAWAHERLGRYLWASGDIDASSDEFRTAAELLDPHSSDHGTTATMAGLAQAALMDADLSAAQSWCHQVRERVVAVEDPQALVMATRVLGAARAETGDLAAGVELCRAAVAAASSAFSRALATAYLGIALIESGDYSAAVSATLDGASDARLAGLDRSFGAYLDSEAVEALLRLGRWDDAAAVLTRRFAAGIDSFHAGRARVLAIAGLLAARRGDAESALGLLADARSRHVDRFHAPVLLACEAELHLAAGNWGLAADAAERGWMSTAGVRPWWAVRFAMLSSCAVVEQALDDIANRAPIDRAELTRQLSERIDEARAQASDATGETASIVAAQLEHAAAMLTALNHPAPDLWATAASRWEALSDRWMAADARLRHTESALTAGDAAAAATSLRAAHATALELSSSILLARVEAVARRTRISTESAEVVVVDDRSAARLGLTPRESEVLAFVAAGRTNRQIGEALYVSEKTASVHVSNILRKLGVSTRVEAAAVAQRLGIE